MSNRAIHGSFVLFGMLVLWNGIAFADVPFIERLQASLYAGKSAAAADAARARLAERPGDRQARFGLGASQFLIALERLGGSLYRYGLATRYADRTGMAGLPVLRIPVPENPAPEKITYDAFRDILKRFVEDLDKAENTLAAIGPGRVDLPLNLGKIRLDLNGDGIGAEDEALWRIFRKVASVRWLTPSEADKLLTDFDGSDVPWLRAYCHLLMAIAELPLAHDWRAAFEATFHGVFPNADLPHSELAKKKREAEAKLRALGPPPALPRKAPGESLPEYQERQRVWLQSEEGRRYAEARALRQQTTFGGIADLIAFVHLTRWPVVEPARMRRVLEHLEEMVRLSRDNWRMILAETDDRREWIPSPKQSGVLPRMRVDSDLVAGWMKFLDEFEALLAGRLLIPHWRFEKGVNLRRFFLEPRTFDLVMLVNGAAVLPYLEDGPTTSGDNWVQIRRLFGGDFFRYFIWFN